MWFAFVRFYCTVLVRVFLPAEGEICIPDPNNTHSRRYTRDYRVKRGWVKNLWIGSSVLMLCFPLAHIVLVVSLLTALLSFAILDETA